MMVIRFLMSRRCSSNWMSFNDKSRKIRRDERLFISMSKHDKKKVKIFFF